VTPINTATNRALKPIKVGNYASAIVITPDGKTVYVGSGPGVTPFSTVTGKAGKSIRIRNGADMIAITPNGKTAYVLNPGASTVTPINAATNKASTPIKAGTGNYIAITP
jgi:YVTN family beta-propeller protein